MHDKVVFTVPGIPRGKARPRFTKQGHAYKDKKDVSREGLISLFYKQAAPETPPHSGAISLKVTAYFLPPKSMSKKKRANPGPKLTKPDLDNIVKSVKDGLNRIAWIDDAQVVELSAGKQFGDCDSLLVEITRL